jgi:hypothetical protein
VRNNAVRPFQAAQIQINLFLVGLRDFSISLVTFFSVKLILAMLFSLPGASNSLLLEGSGRFREVRASPA